MGEGLSSCTCSFSLSTTFLFFCWIACYHSQNGNSFFAHPSNQVTPLSYEPILLVLHPAAPNKMLTYLFSCSQARKIRDRQCKGNILHRLMLQISPNVTTLSLYVSTVLLSNWTMKERWEKYLFRIFLCHPFSELGLEGACFKKERENIIIDKKKPIIKYNNRHQRQDPIQQSHIF